MEELWKIVAAHGYLLHVPISNHRSSWPVRSHQDSLKGSPIPPKVTILVT